ncbi:MAG TPA: di-heme oxidoredictase family protein [Candidatus Binatia bacterium]
MRWCLTPVASIVAVAMLFSIACGQETAAAASPETASQSWRSDCQPIVRPAPLSMDAARDALRTAERRQDLKLREAASPGALMREVHAKIGAKDLAGGQVCPSELAELGERLFEHEFNFADGLGSGEASHSSTGPFRRVHGGLFGGPETISCTSCHWIGGPGGAGAETDDAFLDGDGKTPGAGDARNPQALAALGVVQALAREMTRDLQHQRDALLADAAKAGDSREKHLVTKGIDFGVLRATKSGAIDASGLAGIDGDLVVKPFGWKGTRADIESFASEALQFHLGVQSDDLVASDDVAMKGSGKDPMDPDGDGVRGEFDHAAMAAVTTHLALLEMPVIEPLIQDRMLAPAATGLLAPTTTSFVDAFARGREEFHALGCASCHQPMMVLDSPMVEINGLPPIDLSKQMRQPGLVYDDSVRGYPVWLFSDLKRHDMGEANRARHVQRGVAVEQYLTPRLWGVANSAPYLHDGRAPSLDYAIAGHDGEGAAARAAFSALSLEDKGALRVYLMSLRRAPRIIVP